MFLWLSVIKTMTFERLKTLSNILIWCLIAFDEIHNLFDFLDCVVKLWIHPQTQKSMILSRAMTYLMRMFDMLSKFSRIINLIFKRTYRGFCKFKITNTYYWVPLPPILSLLTIDYHLLLQLLSLPTYYWIPPSITELLPLPPPLLTTDYHDLLLPLLPLLLTADYHRLHLLPTTTTTSTGKLLMVESLPTLLLPPLHHIIATTTTIKFRSW